MVGVSCSSLVGLMVSQLNELNGWLDGWLDFPVWLAGQLVGQLVGWFVGQLDGLLVERVDWLVG